MGAGINIPQAVMEFRFVLQIACGMCFLQAVNIAVLGIQVAYVGG